MKKLGLTKEEAEFYIEMAQLIPVEDDGAVSGHKLHEVLGVKSRFNDWIKNRIKKYQFEENVDYTCLTKTLVTQTKDGKRGESKYTDYILGSNMAKELCMIENNETGRDFRRYFILNERIVKEVLAWEEERNENKLACKTMKEVFKQMHLEEYSKEPTPKDYANLQNEAYIVTFNMTAKELKDALNIKYHNVVPDWVEEQINKALDFSYERLTYLLEDGVLDGDERIKRASKMFDRKYGAHLTV